MGDPCVDTLRRREAREDGAVGEQIFVPGRFCGPPQMGQGGYVGGTLAGLLANSISAEARLRLPTPLDTSLDVSRPEDGFVRALHGDAVVAECRTASFAIDVPPMVSPADAARAAHMPEQLGREFAELDESDRCFGCGPRPDGLCMHPGPVGDDGCIACSVTFPPGLAVDGVMPLEFVWAAVDCPSMWVCLLACEPDQQLRGLTTGSLAVHVHRLPRGDEDDLFVQAWRAGVDGRKHYGDAVLVAGSEILTEAHQTAIAL